MRETATQLMHDVAGARTTIANAAYSFLYPWTQKGNMAVRLKKLHESAQQRYEKYKEWLAKAVAEQTPAGGELDHKLERSAFWFETHDSVTLVECVTN